MSSSGGALGLARQEVPPPAAAAAAAAGGRQPVRGVRRGAAAATGSNAQAGGRRAKRRKTAPTKFVQRPGSGSERRDKNDVMSREVTMLMSKKRMAGAEARASVGGIRSVVEAQRVWDVMNIYRHLSNRQAAQHGSYNYGFEQNSALLPDIAACTSPAALGELCARLLQDGTLASMAPGATAVAAEAAPASAAPATPAAAGAPQHPAAERPAGRKRKRGKAAATAAAAAAAEAARPAAPGAPPPAPRTTNGATSGQVRRADAGRQRTASEQGPSSSAAAAAAAGQDATAAPSDAAVQLPAAMGSPWEAVVALRPLLLSNGMSQQEEDDFAYHFVHKAGDVERNALYGVVQRALASGDRGRLQRWVRQAVDRSQGQARR